MNRDDIIRMALEARLDEPYHPMNPWSASQEALERFAALVAAHEREACAKVAEDYWSEGYCDDAVREIAAEIRARGGE
jgi:hypothetical protein